MAISTAIGCRFGSMPKASPAPHPQCTGGPCSCTPSRLLAASRILLPVGYGMLSMSRSLVSLLRAWLGLELRARVGLRVGVGLRVK
eukprot:scaffold97007_cov21-Phaeocystis_antarctica.AAC.1